MSPVNDGTFDKPPRRQSFVAKMATKTRSKVRNFKSYTTISLLPKFLRPDSASWARFDQDTTEFANFPDQETSHNSTSDISGSECSNDASSSQPKATSRRKSSIKDTILQSRLFSSASYAKRNRSLNTQFLSESPNGSARQSKFFTRRDINIDLGETTFPESISRISSETIISIPDNYNSKKAEWESSMKEQNGEEIVDGFWEECKVEMNKTWKIFTGETTAHGYKRTVAPHRGTWGKMLWAVVILGVSSVALSLLYNTVVAQDLNSFSSSTKSYPSTTMTFPAVTICSLAPYDFNSIDNRTLINYSENVQKFLLKVASLENFKIIPVDKETLSLFHQFDTKDLHDLIGWKLENFIRKCLWNEVPVNCSKIFIQSKTLTEGCFTFNSDLDNLKSTDRVGSFSGLSILVDVGDSNEGVNRVPSGMKVLLHEPSEFPNARENAMLVATGTTTYMSIAKNEYKFLPKPHMAYTTEYCVDHTDQEDESVGDKRKGFYSFTGYSSCVAECRLRVVVDKCRCVVYGRDPEIAKLPYCSMDNYTTCYIPALQNTYTQTLKCGCSLPCRKVEYLSQMSSASFRRTAEDLMLLKGNNSDPSKDPDDIANFVELKIFYKELLTHIDEHVALYNWVTIFGSVGGQLGLFTGASVLTVLEFLELFTLIFWLVAVATYRRFKVRWRSKTHHLTGQWKPGTGHIDGTWKPESGHTEGAWRPEPGHTVGTWRPETGQTGGTWRPETGHTVGTWKPETGQTVGTWKPETGQLQTEI